jgi:hypothetical protein
LLIKLNELAEGGALSKQHNRYKGEMTKKDLWVEPKGIDKYKVQHYARYLHFSQHKNALTVERTDRRFLLVECKNDFADNWDYFKAIKEELADKDVLAAWFEFFAKRDISNAKIQKPPSTKLKEKLKLNQTANSLRYLIYLVNNTFEKNEDGVDTDNLCLDYIIGSKDIYDGYVNWCSIEKEQAVRKQSFDQWLEQLGIICKQRKIENKNVRCYKFSTDELQALFRKYLKMPDFTIIESSPLE